MSDLQACPQRIDAEALGTGINRLMWLQPPGWGDIAIVPKNLRELRGNLLATTI
ncbi:MAG: hypothetical protein WA453_11030 [Methyloceanibacter sp.]